MGICGANTEKIDTASYLHRPDYVVHRLNQAFVRGEFYGYPGTDGSFKSNLIRFILSEHSLLGVFFAHRDHPFSRNERAFFLFSGMSFLLLMQGTFYGNEDMDEYLVGFIVTLIVLPYKKFTRFVMECPCLYDHKYDPEAFAHLSNGKFGGEEVKHCCSNLIEGCGGLITCGNCLVALILLIAGIVLATQHPDEFAINWVYTQGMSLVGTELAVITAFAALGYYVPYCGLNEKDKFEEKWGHMFPKEKPPVSYTDIAALAKWDFVIINPEGGGEKFNKYFPEYDRSFEITPAIDAYYSDWKKAEKHGEPTPLTGEKDVLVAREKYELATELTAAEGGTEGGTEGGSDNV